MRLWEVMSMRMEGFLLGMSPLPQFGQAMWYRNKTVAILNEVIAQIKVILTETPSWFEEELGRAWKHIFPLTPSSIRVGNLELDHPAWNLTPNLWWKFLSDVLAVSMEASKEQSRQQRPSVVPHWDESGWIIQERKLVDFKGAVTTHMGNHPTLKLIQILAPMQRCNTFLCCMEDIVGILKYMMIWKSDWMGSKDILTRMGWSMVEVAAMNTNLMEIEVPLGQFVRMNILLRNCRGALNADFKRRTFEMDINHQPSIMVITETRVGGDKAEKIIEDLSFDGSIVTDTIRYAKGLWILWKMEDVEVILLSATEQEIHPTVKVHSSNLSWLISAIYASPRIVERKIHWNNLKIVSQLHNLPCLMLGDFNEVLSEDDKFGGNSVNLNRALEFKKCLDECNMLDLGFAGPKYTWTNSRPITNLILERIDRCFANATWRTPYSAATMTHLPRTWLDHCPILLELCRPNVCYLIKPF